MDRRASNRMSRPCAELSLALAVAAPAGLFVAASNSYLTEGVVFAVVAALLAIVLGWIGRGQPGESKTVASLGIVVAVLTLLLFCIMPEFQAHAPHAARQSQFINNLKQVGLALENYETAYGRLPPAVVRDDRGRALYSWRVLILPYMNQDALYQKFRLDEPWNSPHNFALLRESPVVYQGLNSNFNRTITYIQAFVGPGSAFEGRDGQPLMFPDGASNFPDGTSRTILLAEAGEGVPWSAPLDMPTGPKAPAPKLGGGYSRPRGFLQSEPSIGQVAILMADGAVKSPRWPIDPETLRALITRNGGEALPHGVFPR